MRRTLRSCSNILTALLEWVANKRANETVVNLQAFGQTAAAVLVIVAEFI